ncbi:MAG: hypothetical protein NT122_06850 [Solirubrobacterales bacterium]|nr:hypothetical protein [Solirubrobacterales bacterium]
MPSPSRSRRIRQNTVRRFGEPIAAKVKAREGGRPEIVNGQPVEAIRDTWLVEDRWWTAAPIRRRYWQVVTASGAVKTIYREAGGRWYAHG